MRDGKRIYVNNAEMAGELVADTGVMHRLDLVLTPEVMSVEVAGDAKKIG